MGFLTKDPAIAAVGEAAECEAAIEITRRFLPHLVAMDINMPKMNVAEVTKRIKTELPQVQVVAFSLRKQPEMIQEMGHAGAAGYVAKDAPITELVRVIRSTADES